MQTKTIFNNLYTSKYFKNLPDFKQQRTQQFITLALTLFAIAFFGIFAITPTLTTIGNLQKQKEDNAFVEQRLDQKKANLVQLSQKYIAIQSDLPLIMNAIPKTPHVPQLTGQFYALSKNTNIQLTRIQIFDVDLTKTQEGLQQYSSFGFSLDARGNYDNLMQYVASLTNFDRIITIDNISLAKGPEKDSNLKLNMRGKAYFKN